MRNETKKRIRLVQEVVEAAVAWEVPKATIGEWNAAERALVDAVEALKEHRSKYGTQGVLVSRVPREPVDLIDF